MRGIKGMRAGGAKPYSKVGLPKEGDEDAAILKLKTMEMDAEGIAIKESLRTRFDGALSKGQAPDFWNYANYVKGYLDKFIAARDLSFEKNHRIKDEIGFLHVLGLTPTYIFYTLCAMGYRHLTHSQICRIIQNEPRWLQEKKKDFMNELNTYKESVFQDMKAQYMQAEKAYMEKCLKDHQTLLDALEKVDPVSRPYAWGKLHKQIQQLERIIKDSHGIDLTRLAVVKADMDIFTHKEKAKIDKGDSGNQERPVYDLDNVEAIGNISKKLEDTHLE